MKKVLIALVALVCLTAGCKKRTDTFAFSGTVIDYYNCTLNSASISEMDFGYVVNLDTPDSIGGEYTSNGVKYKNAVLLYRTHARYGDGEQISGTMYLDENYSRAYCQYHYHLDIPEGVCYKLD